jgi:hypothetical protein
VTDWQNGLERIGNTANQEVGRRRSTTDGPCRRAVSSFRVIESKLSKCG